MPSIFLFVVRFFLFRTGVRLVADGPAGEKWQKIAWLQKPGPVTIQNWSHMPHNPLQQQRQLARIARDIPAVKLARSEKNKHMWHMDTLLQCNCAYSHHNF